jgi:hypothetical protein
MSKIIRTEPNKVLAKGVEFHGFVYLQGVTAKDSSNDSLLEIHGTDKTRLLQAQIWVKDIRDRDALNEVWIAWLPAGGAPARACVQADLADPRLLVEIMVTACK